jgi:hypothetical protein
MRRLWGSSRTRAVRVSAAVALGLVLLTPGAASLAGCFGNCTGATETWGSPTQGERVDDFTWESGPVTGTYLNFPGGQTWLFDPSAVMGERAPVGFEAFVSMDPQPYANGGGGFSQSTGNIAEFLSAGNAWQVNVLNDTCAQYYLRVVLTYPQTSTQTDSGAASDAGAD